MSLLVIAIIQGTLAFLCMEYLTKYNTRRRLRTCAKEIRLLASSYPDSQGMLNRLADLMEAE